MSHNLVQLAFYMCYYFAIEYAKYLLTRKEIPALRIYHGNFKDISKPAPWSKVPEYHTY